MRMRTESPSVISIAMPRTFQNGLVSCTSYARLRAFIEAAKAPEAAQIVKRMPNVKSPGASAFPLMMLW